MKIYAVVVVAALVLSGCATMTQDECFSGDWSMVGYQDGTNGYPPSRLSDHAQACAAHGVRPDANAYYAARERGLVEYCTPYRGFEAGRLDRKYHGVCPPGLARGFLTGYDDGLRVHAATEHLEDVKTDLRRLDRRVQDIEDDLDNVRDQLGSGDLSADTRKALQTTRKNLNNDLRRARETRERARYRERDAGQHADRLQYELSRPYRGR